MGKRKSVWLLLLFLFLMAHGCASDEDKIQDHLAKGSVYFDKEDYKSANIEFKSVLQLDPKNIEAVSTLADISFKLKDPRGAFTYFSQLAQLAPDNVDARL